MAKYRRLKRKFRSGTKYVKQTFQSFFDFNTDTNMQVLSIKSGGNNVTKRLAPFFSAFKYVKMGKVSIKMVPASTLPIDPTGLSYEVGENTVDPRDQLTPGMSRITNGELIFKKIPEDITKQRALYNQMLLDQRWFKWMLQTGVKKIAKPLAWQIAQIYQQPFPDQYERLQTINANNPPMFTGSDIVSSHITSSNAKATTNATLEQQIANATGYNEKDVLQFGTWQIGKNVSFGWIPTDAFVTTNTNSTTTTTAVVNTLPECDLITIITPPAYKTKYYYRCYVTETYYFKEPVSNAFDQIPFYGSLDRFVYPAIQTNMPDGDFITLTGNNKDYKET